MKKNLLVAFMLVVAGNTFAKTAADTLTVTTQPQMHCQNCEKKSRVTFASSRAQSKSAPPSKTRRSLSSTTPRKPNTTTMSRLSRRLGMR